jgi:saccharopine dehydrogenase (NAD+, L-lysine-forming)
VLLQRFQTGGGTLYDIEYLVTADGRRVAAFGYWAGFAGAAVSLKCWAAQKQGCTCGPLSPFAGSDALVAQVRAELDATQLARPTAIVIGAQGRVGTGAREFCSSLGVATTDWDMAETAHGGPFPEVLQHDIFLNCILAAPGCPVFVPTSAKSEARRLSVIGDIACDPTSPYSPVKVYDCVTTCQAPALRVHDAPPLDVTAIDNLPSLLPLESSHDFAGLLLPSLAQLDKLNDGVWGRAKLTFDAHMAKI